MIFFHFKIRSIAVEPRLLTTFSLYVDLFIVHHNVDSPCRVCAVEISRFTLLTSRFSLPQTRNSKGSYAMLIGRKA